MGDQNAAIAFLQLCRKHSKVKMPLPDATSLLIRLLERSHFIAVL
ncbi:hypothetical protein ABN584_26390 [Gloeocapsa sp. BRSZ]